MRRYERLRRAGEIAFVRRRGRAIGFSTLTAYAVAPERGHVRVGIAVSKAVGTAVVRNRVKRRIRGALDALSAPPAARMLFVPKPAAAAAGYARLAADVAAAVSKAGDGR
jgi:ribonuclease P protein component